MAILFLFGLLMGAGIFLAGVAGVFQGGFIPGIIAMAIGWAILYSIYHATN